MVLTLVGVGTRLERPDPSKFAPEPVDLAPVPAVTGSAEDPIKVDTTNLPQDVKIKLESDLEEDRKRKKGGQRKACKRIKMDDDDDEEQ